MHKQLKMILSKNGISTILDILFKYIPIYFFVQLFHRKEQCWLVTERSTDARDNGFVLYKWIREEHPEKRIFYAIHKKSPDYIKVKDLGEIIEFGSYKHWYYYFASTICCGTSWGICSPNSMTFLLMRNILPPKGKRVFLQHGITKDYMSQGRKQKLKADVFVCGAYPEWKYISQYFGYKNGEVKYLGLARYDRLKDTSTKSQILYMPTWRMGIANVSDFRSTNYYHTIKSLLTSPELNQFLVKTNTEFFYFIHPAIRNQKKYFESFSTSHIHVLNNEDFDMQILICSSKLLITDYSSIYFDFAYLKKPVIYYQFDYMDYRKEHYSEGYFNYEKDGFGPIVKEETELFSMIELIHAAEWKVSDKYAQRVDRFFPIHDKNNCLRHYNVLCELESQFQ